MTSARVWLASGPKDTRVRAFARANALGAIGASITGNAAYHAVQAGLLHVAWPIIVLVGAVPATVLGLTAHLHALQGDPPSAVPRNPPRPRPTAGRDRTASSPGTAQRTTHGTDDLLQDGRAADARYRQQHGRPITRDALRLALRISGTRATELRRQLAAESSAPANHTAPDRNAPDRKETRDPR